MAALASADDEHGIATGIEVNVAAQRPGMPCGLHEHRLEAALEQSARAAMTFVEQRRVAAFERVHAGGEIQVGEFEEDVEVVGHEDVCEDSPAAAGGDAVEESEPLVAIIVVADDVAVIDAAIGDVIKTADQFDAQSPRHEPVPW